MTENGTREQELKAVIEETVDSSVERAFQKYGRRLRPSPFSPRNLLTLVLALALVLEAAVVTAEGLCCRGVIRRPWLFALLVNLFSYSVGALIQTLF